MSVSVDRLTSDRAFHLLIETHEDPGGLAARTDVAELGIKAGDVVRSIDGSSPFSTYRFARGTLVYLDVVRGEQTFVVRVAVGSTPRDIKGNLSPSRSTRIREVSSSGS